MIFRPTHKIVETYIFGRKREIPVIRKGDYLYTQSEWERCPNLPADWKIRGRTLLHWNEPPPRTTRSRELVRVGKK